MQDFALLGLARTGGLRTA